VNVTTQGFLQVRFTASLAHCSDILVHVDLDGAEKGVTRQLSPGQQSESIELGPVPSGTSQLVLRAEGVPGGCNDGDLTEWSGMLEVTASVAARLKITSSQNYVTLNWPGSCPVWRLESAPSFMSSGSKWESVSITPIEHEGENEVVLPISPAAGFFRLRTP
jgi:hypothetical protein